MTPSSDSSSHHHHHQSSKSTSVTPNSERKDPFKTLIKPFLKRNSTLESIKDSLKFTIRKHSSSSLNQSKKSPLSSPTKQKSEFNSKSKSTNLTIHDPSCLSQNHQSSPELNLHGRVQVPNRQSNKPLSTRSHQNSISSLSPPSISDHHHHLQTNHHKPLSTPTHSQPSFSPEISSSISPSNFNQSNLTSPASNQQNFRLTTEPNSILSTHQACSSSPILSAATITSSIHSLLTQPALATLTQLAPAQLLSGVHSGSFLSSDAFRVLNDHDHQILTLSSSTTHLSGVQSNHPTSKSSDLTQHLSNSSLPTTIEQLSASSIALPITSISSIWRLLNCIEWINSKERNLLTQPNPSPPKSRFNSYSSHTSIHEDHHPDYNLAHESSFDLANVLQHVGDILSAITSNSDVEIVFYHIFYSPQLESTELEKLHPSSHPHSITHSSSFGNSHKTCPSVESIPSSSLDRAPESSSNVYVGAGADGEGGLREISVKADEKGLIIGLTCLLRQILYRAKRFSTIEVGLHLTPLYKEESDMLNSKSTSDQDLAQTVGSENRDSKGDDASSSPSSKPNSWKCVFDVSLTPPIPPKPDPKISPEIKKLNLFPQSTPTPTIITKNVPRMDDLPPSPTLARLRMSSNLSSELPLCPEESLSKLIFERFLGMTLTTGRLTRSGHSWKVTGIFEKGVDRESAAVHHLSSSTSAQLPPHASPKLKALGQTAREPTADELTLFAETTLKGKKAVFFAAEQSIFAKHITTYLTSWNMDVSHMPYEPGDEPGPQAHKPSISSTLTIPASDPSRKDGSSATTSDSVASQSGETSSALEATSSKDSSQSSSVSSVVHPTVPTPTFAASSKFVRSNHFIIIDDDIHTLKIQLHRLKNSPPTSILLPPSVVQSKHQQQQGKRPPLARQMKTVNQINRGEVVGSNKPLNTSIIHFTSISNFRKVQELIRTHLAGTPWIAIPDVLVVPKPIGPRRILTALHTAIHRPAVEPQFVPIATSPSSPGVPHYFANAPHTNLIGASQLARTSPALLHLNGPDFDTAAANHLREHGSHSTLQTEVVPGGQAPSLQSSTPPGLRTPGTGPGTPGFPSPAMLSSEALEYFSKAASENGGSSSTGVVLQSPDGRPQAMFFHHSSSSVRSNLSFSQTFVNPIHHLMNHHHPENLTSTSMITGNHHRANLVDHAINHPTNETSDNTNNSKGSQSQQIYQSDVNRSRPMIRELLEGSASSSGSKITNNLSSSVASPPTSSMRGGARKLEHAFLNFSGPITTSIHPTMRNGGMIGTNPSDNVMNHAMALDKYEAISPKTPTVSFNSEAIYALQSTQQQQQPISSPILPRPSALLRMPSVPASLPSSITATLPSPRRLHLKSGGLVKSSSASATQTPAHHHHCIPIGMGNPPSMSVGGGGIIPARRASTGDNVRALSSMGKRRASRKPTTTLVPPINVLIVEDNRINQTILATFLRKKLVRYDVAMNGQEAVDKWRTGSFHLVLMDLQLPVKDGIEATKEIREAERIMQVQTPPIIGNLNSSNSSHPISVIIVALTASSLDVDREVALAAGCNDFLTKPVSLAWLEKKLLEWGSMAWLSGFSRAVGGIGMGRTTGTLGRFSQLKLGLESLEKRRIGNKKMGVQIRKEEEEEDEEEDEDEDRKRVIVEDVDEEMKKSESEEELKEMEKKKENRPRISLQVPTPIRIGSDDDDDEEEEEEEGN
ncbi:hypothetical protein DFH28DRAFT_1028492 [Melampsora americana]|nr:hypothetical protein DFH28DRAFT_1028492 [Melampsora americana]